MPELAAKEDPPPIPIPSRVDREELPGEAVEKVRISLPERRTTRPPIKPKLRAPSILDSMFSIKLEVPLDLL
jgi:hypothetical protein